MADIKISALPAVSSALGTDEYVVNQGGVTKKLTGDQFAAYLRANLGAATGTSLALGGATIGSNALAVTGTSAYSGNLVATGSAGFVFGTNCGLFNNSGNTVAFRNAANSSDAPAQASAFSASSFFRGPNATIMDPATDGKLGIRNSAQNAGVVLDVNTDGTIKFFGRDGTTAAPIQIGNTVNSVSPTSPNRTVTMVIGGTTYFLHAKTTND